MIQIHHVEFFRLPMRTRIPFRYGITELRELPHLFVRATVEIDGETVTGVSADGLTPKWFTKDPSTDFESHDLPQMISVIEQAGRTAGSVGRCDSWFDWWFRTYFSLFTWNRAAGHAPLLLGFGFSLIERAVLDAFCRRTALPLHRLLHENAFEIDLTAVRPGLTHGHPTFALPSTPSPSVIARHTVGLSDPLTAADVRDTDRPDDGLPLTLEENIQRYGLTHLKIKLSGDVEADGARLLQIAELCQRTAGPAARFTLDGNENYHNIDDFRQQWQQLLQNSAIRSFVDQSLLFVEQPIHRDHALAESVRDELQAWHNAPPLVIDESDADFSSLPTALELGYRGTSHKNCKGIVKSLANAATIHQIGNKARRLILSAEDLGNVGPVALLQDLAVVALLGITHVERNGHHYFAGLSHLPSTLQQQIAEHHSDLYEQQQGMLSLRLQQGRINLHSVNEAPFGCRLLPDVAALCR